MKAQIQKLKEKSETEGMVLATQINFPAFQFRR